MFGLLVVFMLVASLVVPANMVNPAPVEAGSSSVMRWAIVDTPNSMPMITKELWNGFANAGSEINKLVGTSNPLVAYAITNSGLNAFGPGTPILYKSTNGGVSWSGTINGNLVAALTAAGLTVANCFPAWDVAVAPDDPNVVAVVLDLRTSAATDGPKEVWVSSDGGTTWDDSVLPAVTGLISCIDISMDYGNKRDILVGTRDGLAGGQLWTRAIPSMGSWSNQAVPAVDVIDGLFSPTYVGDASIVLVVSDTLATYLLNGNHDLGNNTTAWLTPVEVNDPGSGPNTSPGAATIGTADLELPSDYSGQSASLRRAYVSFWAPSQDIANETGIYRVDDTIVYELMDTTQTGTKQIYTIAYYGTYASGKLLAGELKGFPCTATVPTWFTDSPTTCPIPCWYPALKPTTGAAGITCSANQTGNGNAIVNWALNGAVATVATGSASLGASDNGVGAGTWPGGYLTRVPLDESAFAISRNNGETWNQLSLIDTHIMKLTDVAPTADCSTIYLASSNNNTLCTGFDSVWRSSSNAAVVAPFPAQTVGLMWERVLCRLTTDDTCPDAQMVQSDYAILRLAPDKEDGQIVFWAAGGSGEATIGGFVTGVNQKAVMWSPDYGDYWANINPRLEVQDMAAESSTVLYILAANGLVQRMPYTGTAWSSAPLSSNTLLGAAHTIATMPEGNVLVGSSVTGNFVASYSSNAAETWVPSANLLTATIGNRHIAYDTDFADNGIIYQGDDADAGPIYRNTIPFGTWATMSPPHVQYYGVVVAKTGGGLYGAHTNWDPLPTPLNCTVERTLYRTLGIPKPGVYWSWDHLNVGADNYATIDPVFSLEPSSLKLCGCLTLDTDTILYAIDNDDYSCPWWNATPEALYPDWTLGMKQDRDDGMLWAYTDCLAKVGPTLTMEDGTLIGCDPVSGRNQEINFTWEQLCLATYYDIEIAKDEAFTQKVFDWASSVTASALAGDGFFYPDATTSPAFIFPVAATGTTWPLQGRPILVSQLECGHKYFWRVQIRGDAFGGFVRSPLSEVRSFTIKAGLPVSADYYGLKLLSPDNGCMGCAVSPASFSWSPFKGTTKYKFVLAKDAALTDVLAEAEVTSTAYEYDGTLDYSTNYFWRVMCVEPAPSDWSATFSFQTEAAPAAPEAPPEAPATPVWVWVIIAMGAILVIVTLVLIFKTRRV